MKMKKKRWICCMLCILAAALLCACRRTASEKEAALEAACLEEYDQVFTKIAKRCGKGEGLWNKVFH